MSLWARWLASRSSGWAAVGALAVIAGLALYIQGLRVDAAYCKGQQSSSKTVERLADRVAETIEHEADEQIEAIEQEGGCAAEPAPGAVLDGLRGD